jgi:hypothetical protein
MICSEGQNIQRIEVVAPKEEKEEEEEDDDDDDDDSSACCQVCLSRYFYMSRNYARDLSHHVPFTGNTNFEIISDVDLPRLKCTSYRINCINNTLTLNINNVGECKIDTYFNNSTDNNRLKGKEVFKNQLRVSGNKLYVVVARFYSKHICILKENIFMRGFIT